MLIGLTGSYGAGKDEVAHYLKTKGFVHYSLSDLIREELIQKKKEITRENLIKKGNELREKFGPGILALKIMERIKQIKNKSARKNFVVSSIRNIEEINVLKKRDGFILVFVDAPLELRFQRTRLRNRENDPKTLKEFKQKEKIEQSSKRTAQQLHLCKKLAKVVIVNGGSLGILHHKINCFLGDWQPKAQEKIRLQTFP